MIDNFLVKLIIVFLLFPMIIGCSEVDFAYIKINSLSQQEAKTDYENLNKELSGWAEFKFSSQCVDEHGRRVDSFLLNGVNHISMTTVLSKDTNLVVLSFSQLGGFDAEGNRLFAEITSRIKDKFGESRVYLLTDMQSGKYTMADQISKLIQGACK